MSDKSPTSHSPFTSYSHLNWCSKGELLGNQALLTPFQRRLLANLEEKETIYAEGFDHGPYFTNAYALIAADDRRAQKLACCGRNVRPGHRIPCDLWHYCSRCSYSRSCTAWSMYLQSFPRERFYFITLAFEDDLPFDVTCNVRILGYWSANEHALRSLTASGSIRGAYWVHELSVRQYLPTRVQAHTHAVIHADRFTQETLDAFCPLVRNFRSETFDGMELTPSLMVKPIPTKADFYRVLGYCTKALDLSDAYNSAFTRVVNRTRSRIPELNRSFKDFIEEYPAVMRGIPRIGRCGTMMVQRKDFVGARKPDREQALKDIFRERQGWASVEPPAA